MGKKEVEIAGKKLVIHELEDVCDPNTGRALTGSWVWDSALHLAKWIATQGLADFQLQSKTVLELGAGTGLPGLMAASLGAAHVFLTDIAPVLPGLRSSVEANGFNDRVVEVRELVWGSDEPWVGEVDLVLMSDVFYDPLEMPELAKTLKRVCGRETRIWSASEIRSQTGVCLEVLKGEGFEVVGEFPSSDSPLSTDDLEITAEKSTFAVFVLAPPPNFPNRLEQD